MKITPEKKLALLQGLFMLTEEDMRDLLTEIMLDESPDGDANLRIDHIIRFYFDFRIKVADRMQERLKEIRIP